MPKMTHWNSADTIDATPEKLAVYQAQGWVTDDAGAKAPAVTAVTTQAPAETPKKKASAKKAAAKKAK